MWVWELGPVLIAICLAFFPLSAIGRQKPLRIVAGYHDLENIRRHAGVRYDVFHQVFIRRQGEGRAETCSIAADELASYSAVVFAGLTAKMRSGSESFSPSELELIQAYLEGGGTIAVSFNAYLRNLRSVFDHVVGPLQVRAEPARRPFAIEAKGHPLVRFEDSAASVSDDEDVLDALLTDDGESESLLETAGSQPLDPMRSIASRYSVRKPAGAFSLAGDGEWSAYMILPVGEGRFILMPPEVFPDMSLAQVLNNSGVTREMKQETLEKRQRLAANLLQFLDAPPLGDVIADGMQQEPELVFWYREIPTITTEGPERLDPPYPVAGEQLNELVLDVGRTEWERRLFFTTLRKSCSRLSARLSRLTGDAGDLSMDHTDILALLKPTPGFSGPFVYLGKPIDLPPAGEPFVSLDRAASILWCLRLHVTDAAPGVYRGEVMMNADGERFSLPITVRVWPVGLPRRYVDHDVEYFFRTRYDYDSPKMADRLADYTAALDDFQVHWVNWALGGAPGYASMGGRLRENGQSLVDAIRADPRRFEDDAAPMLDLSHQDRLFHLMIAKGIRVFRTYQLNVDLEKVAELAREAYGNPDIDVDSPETAMLATYWMREQRRYLREKGFARVYTKLFDEWQEDALPAFLREARIARAAGWRVIANPNQKRVLDVAENRDRVWPMVDCWWYAYNPAFMRTAWKMEESGQLAGNEFWRTQTSSYWWNIAIRYGYQAGWELAYAGFPGHHFHGWKRDPPGGVWLDRSRTPYTVFPSVGYELLGEGLEEGQYLSMALGLVERADGGRMEGLVSEADARLREIVGPGKDSILRFRDLSKQPERSLIGIGWDHSLTFTDFYRAKREMLALLADLQASLPPREKTLTWGRHVLVRAGRAEATIAASAGRPYGGILNEAVEAKSGIRLQKIDVEESESLPFTESALSIAIGSRGEPWIDALAARHPRCGVTGNYPRPGSYLVYSSLDGRLIMIVGGDRAGTELGSRNFGRFVGPLTEARGIEGLSQR